MLADSASKVLDKDELIASLEETIQKQDAEIKVLTEYNDKIMEILDRFFES